MNWPTTQLGSVSKIFNGKTPSKAEQRQSGNPVLKIKDIDNNGHFKGNFASFVDNIVYERFSQKHLKLHDTLILNAAHNAKYVGSKKACVEKGVVNSMPVGEWLIARANEKLLPRYLFFYLSSPFACKVIRDLVKGIHLYPKDVAQIPIPLPPLKTQKRIVELLDKAQALIDKRKEQIALMDQLIQSLFYDMFGDPVTNPKGWECKELGLVSEIKSGVTKGRRFAGKETVFVPYMRVANVQDGFLNLDDIAKIEVLPSDIVKYKLQKKDILLTEGGDPDKLGRGTVWNGEIENCIHQNHIFRIRLNSFVLIPEYASILIGSARGKRYFLKSARQTTGIATINMTQLKKCPMLIPPKKTQNTFADRVQKIESQKAAMTTALKELQNNFNTLMQSAFKGELV
jgi:type I restriction enzyme, S subunit